MAEPRSRFHWPRDAVAVRVPPRRLASAGEPPCELIAFTGTRAEPTRRASWKRIGETLARGTRVVLLVAADDVSFTAADVPALSGMRLREALPNLVEEKTVGDAGTLHVALGQPLADGRARALAIVDRTWLAALQVHVARAGLRTAAIVPESLAVPLGADAWSVGCSGTGDASRAWLRTGAQQAVPLPMDGASAAAVAAAFVRQSGRPGRIDSYATSGDGAAAGAALGAALAASLGTPHEAHATDPFAAWLAGDGPDGGYGPPLSLFAFDAGAAGSRTWRLAAALALAIGVVQVAGMQWEWAGLRREAADLQRQSAALVTTTFPDTKVVLDAPLQMSRGLATLRASAGRSDPADFSAMMAASGRIFAALPSNALRSADYDARALRLRFAPTVFGNAAGTSDERERYVAAAAAEGYALGFDAAANAAGETLASLRMKGGATGSTP